MIPAIPSLPVIHRIPKNYRKHLHNLNTIEKLRCLNLTQAPLKVIDEKTQSVFYQDIYNSISINEEYLNEFFKISIDEAKAMSGEKMQRTSITESLSSYIGNTNKYTAIYVSIRRLSSQIRFDIFIENGRKIFIEDSDCEENVLKGILNVLSSYEILNTIRMIFPNETECKNIATNSHKFSSDENLPICDKWLIMSSDLPELKTVAESLIELHNLKYTFIEFSQLLNAYSNAYSFILTNPRIKVFFSTILKINNYLNKQTGKKEISSFDFKNIENLLEMKVNNKHVIDLIVKIYFKNSSQKASLMDDKEYSQISALTEPHNSRGTLYQDIQSSIKSYKDNWESVELLVKNSEIKAGLKETYSGMEESLEELASLMEKEDSLVREMFAIFHYNPKQLSDDLGMLLKTLLKCENKVKAYMKADIKLEIEKENSAPKQNEKCESEKRSSSKAKQSSALNEPKHSVKMNIHPSSLFNLKYKL